METDVNENIEDAFEEEMEETIPFIYSITSYGADYPVDGLVKRIRDGSVFIPPFQRAYVWTLRDASRFVESLLLGLPVPGIFLSRDEETKKLLVIDGQQRLRTLQYFYDGIFSRTGREFALDDKVQDRYIGLTYKSLSEQDRRRLDDSIIHATIVRQEEPSADNSSIFHIFERLNTSGRQLQPQEIRAALFFGEFNDLLKELNNDKSWRILFGHINPHMRDQELILRFLALFFKGGSYKKPIKEFLNQFMGSNRHLKIHTADQIRKLFTDVVETVYKCLGKDAFRPRRVLIAALVDAIMVGIALRLSKGEINDCAEVKKQYQKLLKDSRFLLAIMSHTSDEENVRDRIQLSTTAFAKVK